jgi:peptide/nickel transport system substrate-binding protein
MRPTRWFRLLGLLLAMAMITMSCGSSDDDTASTDDAGDATTTTQAIVSTTAASSGGGDASEDDGEEPADIPPAEGTLRMVEFSAVTSFDPAGSQTAQATYLYPVYDTLLLQDESYGLQPNLATSWNSPEPTVWEFELVEDAVFHDGAAFDAQVAADNLLRAQAFEGNPNASTWTNMVSAEATGDYSLRVEFSEPQPQFLMQMTMVMGMMVSPNAFGEDLTRNPAGSGPWIWNDGQSQAGVTEVYTLFDGYWDPAKQGVEIVEITAVADNNARLNAGLTGDAEIVATLRDAQIDTAEAEGWETIAVQNYFPMIIIQGRSGVFDDELMDERVRQAIGYSIDRDAYVDSIHDGRGSTSGGFYPPALGDWYVPELDNKYSYDPDRARELLAEAGYPDGITIKMPVMPAIQPHLEILTQMLGASGITVDLIQINNGELGPRAQNHEWDIFWNRALQFHPAADLANYGLAKYNHSPEDTADLDELMSQAAVAETQAEAAALYAEVEEALLDRGIIIPLGHGGQNAAWNPDAITAPVMGLNMQGPMPYGVRLLNS